MEMTGEYVILAPRQDVWDALNDPEVLKNCLSGCERFEKISDSVFEVSFTTKVGPIKTTFVADITLSDVNPPNSYTLSGEGNGGTAGLAKGSAKVYLQEDNGSTVLKYIVDASLKGKIGQMGARVVDGVAKKMANDFFGQLTNIINERVGVKPEILVASGWSTYKRIGYLILSLVVLAIIAFFILK